MMINLLIQALPDGEDKDIIMRIYEEYSGMVRGKAMNILKNKINVDDIVQDVFIKVIKSAENFKNFNERQTTAYLSILTKNTIIDFCRKKKREASHETLYSIVETKFDVSSLNASNEFLNDELFELMYVLGLDEITAKIMFEKHVEKATMKEISQRYNMPIGTVATVLARGKDKFRKKGKINEE